MDLSRAVPGQNQAQTQEPWWQPPAGYPLAPGLPFDSSTFVASAPLPEHVDGLVPNVHAAQNNYPRSWGSGRDGLLPQNTSSWVPSASNEGVSLPSLNETRLLPLPFGFQSRNSSNSLPLPEGMHPPAPGVGGLRRVNQSSPFYPPPGQYSGSTTPASNTSHPPPRFQDYAPPLSAFTDVYHVSEQTWHRVLGQPPADLPANPRYTQTSARSGRRVPRPLRSASRTRTLQPHARRQDLASSHDASMSPALTEPAHGHGSSIRAQIWDLQTKIQWALLHPDYFLRWPDPPMDISSLEDKTCDICYQEFGVANPEGHTEPAIKLPNCGHVFGCACLGTWLKSKANWNCPMCRTPIDPDVMSVYDVGLWKKYLRVRRTITEQEELAMLQRILDTKGGPHAKVRPEKIVLEARISRTRPPPDRGYYDGWYQPPRVRARLNEPEGDIYSEDELSEHSEHSEDSEESQPRLDPPAYSAAPRPRTDSAAEPSDAHGGREDHAESGEQEGHEEDEDHEESEESGQHDVESPVDPRYVPLPDHDASDTGSEQPLSDVESVDTPDAGQMTADAGDPWVATTEDRLRPGASVPSEQYY